MASKYLTVVYDVSDGSGREILECRQWSAASWSHALDERTAAESALAELRAEVERLTARLKKANSQAEEFERKFYLADDRADAAEARLRQLLAAVEAEMSPEWECNSYHPSLHQAADEARAFLGEGK